MAPLPSVRRCCTSAKPFRRKVHCPFSVITFQLPRFRYASTTSTGSLEGVINTAERPRWSYTPEAMRAPVRHRGSKDPRFMWQVNEDPEKLDRMYNRLLGNGGDKMLTEEVKWLAVTHKSFDQGRRGYNDRLSFMGEWMVPISSRNNVCSYQRRYIGRRVVTLQASFALINSSAAQNQWANMPEDSYGRTPFRHPALEGLDALTESSLLHILDKKRIRPLASSCGLVSVLRWLPKQVIIRLEHVQAPLGQR